VSTSAAQLHFGGALYLRKPKWRELSAFGSNLDGYERREDLWSRQFHPAIGEWCSRQQIRLFAKCSAPRIEGAGPDYLCSPSKRHSMLALGMMPKRRSEPSNKDGGDS